MSFDRKFKKRCAAKKVLNQVMIKLKIKILKAKIPNINLSSKI